MTIQLTNGDLLRQDDVDAIVNTVNCVGVMGKGIALQFKNKWPANTRAYELACKARTVRPGKMFIYDSGGLVRPNFIINFPTKDHWKGKSKIEYIQDGLVDLISEIKRLDIKSIAIPPLGCGNGGLEWNVVRPLIEEAFEALPSVEVRLFEPNGAPPSKEMIVSTKRPKMTPGRAAILLVLETYKELNYGLSKIEIQKLAYFLQTAGQDLKLNFKKFKYGPYSDELRHALNKMEGHFIRGMGDGVSEAEIEPDAASIIEARDFVQSSMSEDVSSNVNRVSELIEGFQSPYGMELLATVHWVANNENARTPEEALFAIQQWNDRKKALMRIDHIRAAWMRLESAGWIKSSASVVMH